VGMYSAEVANKELKDGHIALYTHDLLARNLQQTAKQTGRMANPTTVQGLEERINSDKSKGMLHPTNSTLVVSELNPKHLRIQQTSSEKPDSTRRGTRLGLVPDDLTPHHIFHPCHEPFSSLTSCIPCIACDEKLGLCSLELNEGHRPFPFVCFSFSVFN
jgi:hypothetical protein